MVNSVDEYVAGEEYDLDDATSDRFVIVGYAEGDLSRDVSDEERNEMLGIHQAVSV
jgi:hypothetical protein